MNRYTKQLAPAALVALLAGCGAPPPPAAPAAKPYVAMARGRIDVDGGLVRVAAQRAGVVVALNADEGETATAGQVLAQLDRRPAERAVATAEAELAQARASAAALAARLPALERSAGRLAAAAGDGAATGQSADSASAAVAELKAAQAAAAATTVVAEQHVENARLELEQATLRAPVAGRIVQRAVQVGDGVAPGAPLFALLPERPRIVRAELNEAFVAQVKPGMRADVTLDADPSQHYSARVLRIGDVYGPVRLAEDPDERATAREVDCVLALDERDLRIGQRVLVRFLP